MIEASTGRAPARPDGRGGGLRKGLELALLLGPALALFAGFVLAPIAVAAYDSLHKWQGFGPLEGFIGLA
ncbi:MAG TPA: sugar ABC transporter permease, partial [Spirochaetia bacterium]|nr:sugar ABC transporter permease [Spirochaetia bacterium]